MDSQLTILPINSLKYKYSKNNTKQESFLDSSATLKYMMSYERLTCQTPNHENFSLFEDHLTKLNNYSWFNYNSTLKYFFWKDSVNDFQESTLVSNKSFPNGMNSSLEIKEIQLPRPKRQVLLQVFIYDITIKKKFARLERLIKTYTHTHHKLLHSAKFLQIMFEITQDLWTKLSVNWLRWYDTQTLIDHDKFGLEKNTVKSLLDIFKDHFFQNYFFIKTSEQCSLDGFSSVLEHSFETFKGKHHIKSLLLSQNLQEIKTFGIWLDLDNKIILFANATIKETMDINCFTRIVTGYCLSNLKPELLNKKIILFLNLSLLEFFKSQVC
ncbi:hypothetical protein MOUN0_H01376 [Monosporozyma unispora]